ncbi:MAG: TonB-dependent receptor domain-containing protein, partial [Bacteroidales bacterium]
GRGIMPNNTLNRHNFDLKGTGNFFNKFLEVGSKLSYTQQEVNNPFGPGSYLNPMSSFAFLSANTPMHEYKEKYQNENGTPNWVPGSNGFNPYWELNKVLINDELNRLLSSVNVKMNFTDYLNLAVRGTIDNTNQTFTRKMYAGTNPSLASATGAYERRNNNITQGYADALLSFNKDIIENILTVNAMGGASIRDYENAGTEVSSNRTAMFHPDVFTTSNLDFAKGARAAETWDRNQVQSIFYSVEFAYNNALFFSTTGRNDWSSTLPASNNNYFYPSFGLSALLTDLIPDLKSNMLNYLKTRVSYTQVGNDLPSFIINPTASIGHNGSLNVPSTIIKPGETLRPELTSSIEAGIDFSLFNNLVRFEGTYYKTNTTNQLFTVAASAASGYSYNYVNGGNIQNQGVELSLSVLPTFGDLKWESTINFSKNTNKVLELTDGANQFIYSNLNNSTSYYQKIVVGGSLGDIYAKKWERDTNGKIVFDIPYFNGVPKPDQALPKVTEQAEKIGNANPDFLMSWGNSFNYKGIRLSFLIDGRFGGKIISLTDAALDAAGNSIASAEARNNGGKVDIEGTMVNARTYYELKGGLAGSPLGEYAQNATTIRLRELSLGYSLRNFLEKKGANKYIKDISVSFIARNLFYFYRPASVDSELVSSNTGGQNGFLGLELYNLPATRNIGFGVNLTF